MSGGQSGYELSEAKAIVNELKSIRKAISSGEKEKQDLMQVFLNFYPTTVVVHVLAFLFFCFFVLTTHGFLFSS